jgi:hypothetical protein
MADLKTSRTAASVPEFLAAVADPRRRSDAEAICALMAEVTDEAVLRELVGTAFRDRDGQTVVSESGGSS